MKKVLRGIWSVLEVVIIIYVIVITVLVLAKNKYGYTQIGDYTFENIGLIDERNIVNTKKGDLLIVKNSNDIKEGDLIYYYAPYNEAYVVRSDYVTHIESDDFSALYTVVRNKEDITVSHLRVLGKYARSYPKLGAILDVLESRIGFLFLVLLPIMIVFIYQVYEFIVILRYEQVDEIADSEEKKPQTDQVSE